MTLTEVHGPEPVAQLVQSLDLGNAHLRPRALRGLVTALAGAEELWLPVVRHDPLRRWYRRLYLDDVVDVWLLGWDETQSTTLHDHGGSSGAFWVCQGALVEDASAGPTRPLARHLRERGRGTAFGPAYVHRVSNPGPGPATSIHAYSPPLTTMTVYRLAEAGEAPGRLPHAATGSGGGLGAELGAGEEFLLPVETVPADGPEPGEEPRPAGRSVEELLVEARSGLARLTPAQAAAALAGGALLVDIRPPETRRAEGEVPGAVAIARNVLEWRLDPAGDARLPGLSDYGSRVVVMCDEGYASSFAARGLRRLGLDGTDVIGGFRAWMAAGLPVVPWSSAL